MDSVNDRDQLLASDGDWMIGLLISALECDLTERGMGGGAGTAIDVTGVRCDGTRTDGEAFENLAVLVEVTSTVERRACAVAVSMVNCGRTSRRLEESSLGDGGCKGTLAMGVVVYIVVVIVAARLRRPEVIAR